MVDEVIFRPGKYFPSDRELSPSAQGLSNVQSTWTWGAKGSRPGEGGAEFWHLLLLSSYWRIQAKQELQKFHGVPPVCSQSPARALGSPRGLLVVSQADLVGTWRQGEPLAWKQRFFNPHPLLKCTTQRDGWTSVVISGTGTCWTSAAGVSLRCARKRRQLSAPTFPLSSTSSVPGPVCAPRGL